MIPLYAFNALIFLFNPTFPIVINVFGEKWLPAYEPFLITILLSMLRSFTSFFEPILLINSKTNYKLFLATLNAFLVPILVYYFVMKIGINGAPMGVLLSNLVSSFFLIYLTRNLIRIKFNEIIYPIILIIFVSLIFYNYELNWLIKIFILLFLISIEVINVKLKRK